MYEYENSKFQDEMEILRREKGSWAVSQAFGLFTTMLRWRRIYGGGNLIVPTMDHMFKNRIKVEALLKTM